MARKKSTNSPTLLDVSVTALAKLPWWLCLTLAVLSFGYLRTLDPTAITMTPGSAVKLDEIIENSILGGLLLVAQHAVPVILLAAAGLSYFARAHRQKLLRGVEQARSLEALQHMSWQEFELLVGEAFRRRGYGIREHGGAGPDGGVDLVLTKAGKSYLVQCKQWKSTTVGVDIVRQHFGVMAAARADGGFVVTSGRFTDAAREFGQGRVALIDGAELYRMIQETKAATTAVVPPPPAAAAISVPVTAPAASIEVVQAPSPSSKSCPKCNGAMTLRTARKGPSSGNQFWGCNGFPACRGVREL